TTLYIVMVATLAAGFMAVWAPPAAATFHLIKVREVYAGSATDPMSQYVELQFYSANQIFLAGHKLTAYDATGKDVGDFTFTSIVSNAADQSYVLLATPQAESQFGVTADLAMTPVLTAAGGKVCWATDQTPPVDCASWGSYNGPADDAGNPFAPSTGIPPGSAMQRKISAGDPSKLEAEDDTNNSSADFQLAQPDPHSNGSAAPSSSPPPPTSQKKHGRTISLGIEHRTATGKVSVKDGFDACRKKVPVKLQKKRGAHWKTVDSGRTSKSGGYTLTAGHAGTFRAVAPEHRVGDDTC
ncbi:MAG: hypothetical protein M3290_05655, partial [Actinomycetota bacterium]|nr:hypothetical protein [Actinomycetota bacterium]